MLSWKAGPRHTGAVWASYWYAAVLASTCLQAYEQLRERRLRLG